MEKRCFLSIQKVHTMGQLKRMYEHNSRIEDCPIGYPPNADKALADLNEDLIDMHGLTYPELWAERIKQEEKKLGHEIKRRKTSVLAYDIVMTFSRNANVDIEEWKQDNKKWLCEQFGEENVLAMQCHQDEPGNIHIHAMVVPLTKDGRLCARDFTGGRQKMTKFQTEYGKAMAKHNLERGLEYSRAKHQDIRRFYAALNHAVDAKVPEQKENESTEDYILRVNEFLQEEKLKALGDRQEYQRNLDVERTKLYAHKKKYKKAELLQDRLNRTLGETTTNMFFDGLIELSDSIFVQLIKKFMKFIREEILRIQQRNEFNEAIQQEQEALFSSQKRQPDNISHK